MGLDFMSEQPRYLRRGLSVLKTCQLILRDHSLSPLNI